MWTRSLLILLLLVLIAAAINLPLTIAVMPAPNTPMRPGVNVAGAEAAARGWPADPPVPWPAVSQWSETRTFAFRQRQAWSAGADRRTTHQMQLDQYGWPLPALQHTRFWWPWDDPKWSTTASPDPGLTLAWGVVANPLINGAAAWVLLVAPVILVRSLRRWLRRRRGRCVACGYPVGNSATCTECGGPVHSGDGSRPPAASPGD